MRQSADDVFGQAYLQTFLQALGSSGWTIGRNVKIDTWWTASAVGSSEST
jgi:hypothetical protein